MLAAGMKRETAGGVAYDTSSLDACERDFWGDVWQSVPAELAREKGVERRDFGPVRASIARELPRVGMMNLVLGATEPGAVEGGHLAAAVDWAESQGVNYYVPVTPGLPETEAAEAWLRSNGNTEGYAWMKFIRDAHPPRFAAPDVEVIELTDPEQAPFGMVIASGFGLPAWASAFFAKLPGHEGWRCYGALVDGEVQACAAMHLHGGLAEVGPAATLEPARGRGCQMALLHRRIADAIDAGCDTFWVETGERVPDKPSASYRNILKAGFEEAYLRPNWRRAH
jgi:GNAT superfamily N-acetyltransferase